MCEFSLQASVQASTQNFFAEIVQSASFCYRLSKVLWYVEIQLLEVGLNIFNLVKGKIRHSGMSEDSGSRIKAQLLA